MEAAHEILSVMDNGARMGIFIATGMIPILLVLRWFGR